MVTALVVTFVAIDTVTCYKPSQLVLCHVGCLETYEANKKECRSMLWCNDVAVEMMALCFKECNENVLSKPQHT